MKDFTKSGGTYHDMSPLLTYLPIFAMVLTVVTLIVYVIFFRKGKNKSDNDLPFFIILIMLLIMEVVFITNDNDTHQDYKGRFEIVKSNAGIVDSVNNSDDRYIILKDKDGNRQKVEVGNQDGSFEKGKYADVTVKIDKDTDKPTLKKPIDSGDYEIKNIKQAD